MNNGYKDNDFLLARIFTSSAILLVLFALLTSALPSVASAQEQNENLTQYLLANEEYIPGGDVAHWDNADYWSEHVIPPDTCNSIFVVGDGFHLRAHNGTGNTQQIFGTSDSTKPNFLYIG